VTLWIGTYAEQGGRGLTPLASLDPLTPGAPNSSIANASFGVWSPARGLAYLVDECEEGRVGAWKHGPDGWSQVGTCASGGAAPCFLALSHDGAWLAAANYGDGSVALIRLDPQTGAPELVDVYHGEGHGSDPERQDGPHAHCIVFGEDDACVYHVDLGTDRIFRHDVGSSGFAQSRVAFEAPAGIGPRHLMLLPDRNEAVLICELGARLLLLRREQDRFVCLDDVPTAPEPCDGNLGGHLGLAADGAIYVTNRGHDSLVRFAIEGDRLVRQAWWPTGGSSPRHFVIDGTTALVAHEEGGGVTRLDLMGGVIGQADIPAAAFLIDIPD
jgi:6-phosphogluconolactonase